MANSLDPDQTAPCRSSLIWVYAVCPDLSVQIFTIIMVRHLPISTDDGQPRGSDPVIKRDNPDQFPGISSGVLHIFHLPPFLYQRLVGTLQFDFYITELRFVCNQNINPYESQWNEHFSNLLDILNSLAEKTQTPAVLFSLISFNISFLNLTDRVLSTFLVFASYILFILYPSCIPYRNFWVTDRCKEIESSVHIYCPWGQDIF